MHTANNEQPPGGADIGSGDLLEGAYTRGPDGTIASLLRFCSSYRNCFITEITEEPSALLGTGLQPPVKARAVAGV